MLLNKWNEIKNEYNNINMNCNYCLLFMHLSTSFDAAHLCSANLFQKRRFDSCCCNFYIQNKLNVELFLRSVFLPSAFVLKFKQLYTLTLHGEWQISSLR